MPATGGIERRRCECSFIQLRTLTLIHQKLFVVSLVIEKNCTSWYRGKRKHRQKELRTNKFHISSPQITFTDCQQSSIPIGLAFLWPADLSTQLIKLMRTTKMSKHYCEPIEPSKNLASWLTSWSSFL